MTGDYCPEEPTALTYRGSSKPPTERQAMEVVMRAKNLKPGMRNKYLGEVESVRDAWCGTKVEVTYKAPMRGPHYYEPDKELIMIEPLVGPMNTESSGLSRLWSTAIDLFRKKEIVEVQISHGHSQHGMLTGVVPEGVVINDEFFPFSEISSIYLSDGGPAEGEYA